MADPINPQTTDASAWAPDRLLCQAEHLEAMAQGRRELAENFRMRAADIDIDCAKLEQAAKDYRQSAKEKTNV